MMTSRSPRVFADLIACLGGPERGFDLDGGLQHVVGALDADIGGLVVGAEVLASVGADGVADAAETLGALRDVDVFVLPGHRSETLHIASGSLSTIDGVLLVARYRVPFDAEELGLVDGLGPVIGMAMRVTDALHAERILRLDLERRNDDNHRLVGQLRERQGLLDRLSRIQKSISHRLPTQEVLDAITEGARDLLSVEQASIRLCRPERPDLLVLASHVGVDPELVEAHRETVAGDHIPSAVIDEGRLVTRYDLPDVSLMCAAVEVDGSSIGCLNVADGPARRFSPAEQDALLVLAQHASLALQDARATDAMRTSLERERHRARHDGLTALANRATVRTELADRLTNVESQVMSVLFVDLDRFKLANDTLGHAFGDEVLTVVADRLRTAVRQGDLVGRLSGDEFVVVCEGISSVGAIEFAERLQAAISRPLIVGDVEHVITASVGIAEAAPGQSADEVLANADLAMYRAKQAGRARIDVFDDLLRSQVADRLSIGQGLRRAIEDREFVVHLQPLVELPTRRVTGFEALVRWEHPTRGTLAPASFLPFAEELGLIASIDRIVLEQSIALLGEHRSARPIAVNLSVRTFGDAQLVTWLTQLLAAHDVGPERLVVEVTETVLMDESGIAARQIEALRDLGVGVMIDDFGTGYSSLSYLQAFDVDGVKIDQSFIARLAEDPRAEAIVAAVFNMAEALDLSVVAEGIEVDDQVDRMLSISSRFGGVSLTGQGYLFGHPAEAEGRLAGFVEVPVELGVG